MVKYGYIYGLIDPENQEIFYIGKTVNPKVRLSGHISPSNLKKKSSCIERLNLIINKNNRPILKILLKCKFKNINKFEKMYITRFRKLNLDLTNERSGGESWNISKKRRTEKVIAADKLLMKSITLRNSVTLEDIEFPSLSEAAKFLNVKSPAICAYLRGKVGCRKCKGFYIRYTGEEFIEPAKLVKNFKILKYSASMELLKVYDNRNELILDGYDDRYIYKTAISKVRKSAHGFIWRREYD